ncbi:hypothetical protein CALCODRAFT_429229 [Calocera cornea HHB12733]|uniref:DH domain-containing protein n=1 Tax=Calocera cornea HHB12733 TaxID=1353952 RepID=A0A165IGA2_9BASI|nr:hypothetical protein CALCODRAFT_429229 [Calocera cornea HHB12733]
MRLVIRLFIQPLRDRSQPPTWIPGVPADVGRLFDWLDDIVQLHAEFARVLHSARQSQYPVVMTYAGLLIPLIAKLEVHQPYLVRLEEVSRTIDTMMKQPESDFGEFLRMQSVSDEWDGLSLSSWLLKPVQRLAKYTLFFKVGISR